MAFPGSSSLQLSEDAKLLALETGLQHLELLTEARRLLGLLDGDG